jgi:hypothetical protein
LSRRPALTVLARGARLTTRRPGRRNGPPGAKP